ncbi:MAG: DNA topoisomerase IB [Akkermansiaceae bacterium]
MTSALESSPKELVYTTDSDAGYSRRGAGKGFAYYDCEGELIKDKKIKARLNSLALPPAYRDVWFCSDPNGHLQATGIDQRKRKQYRYHQQWSLWRSRKKFDALVDFAKKLPLIRESVAKDIDSESLIKSSVIAAVIRLLDNTSLRIGNEAYYKENGTSGLTTLRHADVETEDGYLKLDFTAKGGKARQFDIYLPTLSKIVEQLDDLPGQRLFKYKNDEAYHPVTSSDVNEWLKEKTNADISAKDFRTWRASHLTLNHLLKLPEISNHADKIEQEKTALKATSKELGHRPPVCKKHYVHPRVLESHRNGTLKSNLKKHFKIEGLSEEENTFYSFLINTESLL